MYVEMFVLNFYKRKIQQDRNEDGIDENIWGKGKKIHLQ